jgi:hypothetical protein
VRKGTIRHRTLFHRSSAPSCHRMSIFSGPKLHVPVSFHISSNVVCELNNCKVANTVPFFSDITVYQKQLQMVGSDNVIDQTTQQHVIGHIVHDAVVSLSHRSTLLALKDSEAIQVLEAIQVVRMHFLIFKRFSNYQVLAKFSG